MNRIIYCLRTEHDWKLVVLAALVCLVSSTVTIIILSRAQNVAGKMRLGWIAAAGGAGGFGIWATHFIAMMAFHPGLSLTFDLRLTLLSLVCAMVITGGGAEIALSRSFKGASWVGGAVMGSGICTMHYLGMMAVDVAGHIQWAPDLVISSLVLGLGLGALAMAAFNAGKPWSYPASAGLLLLAIVSHHFTAMGAVDMVADPLRIPGGTSLSPASMSLTLAVAAFCVLAICTLAVRWGQRLDDLRVQNDHRFESMLSGVKDYAISMLDLDGVITGWHAGAEHITGYTADEVVGKRFVDIVTSSPENALRHTEALKTALTDGRCEIEFPGHRKDGTPFWGHCVVTPVHDTQGKLLGCAHVTQDVTNRRANDERLQDMSRNLDAALSHMSHGLCLFDRNERLILANSRFIEIYPIDPAMVQPGISFRALLAAVMRLRDDIVPDECALEDQHTLHRTAITKPHGDVLISDYLPQKTVAISHRPMPEGGWVSTFEDITERRRTELRIAHMARHDGLTGLPNRLHFNEYLDQELARASRRGEDVAVVLIDLDRFKDLNDQRGHEAGDKALKILADRLADLTSGDDRFVARLGGDEFAAIKRFDSSIDVRDCVAKVHECIREPILVDGIEIILNASLGVAVYPQDGTQRDTLLNNADLALYRAKLAPQTVPADKVCFYAADMDEAARDRRALAKDLQQALANEEFRVFYQVQKSVKTREITGYEALIRWKHPTRGFVSPADFISVAEESGAIVEMGAWVLRTACREAARWNTPVRIAVNLSPVQLADVNLIGTVRSVLAETGLAPDRLELEITESMIIDDKLTALHILRQIKALGVTIAIDDFGTGYASLDTLNAFPFDKIKIDRSFLMEADKSPQARAIVRAVLALGRSLNIPVLAEGVETEAQLAILREEGCDEAQGYLLGRPAEEIQPALPPVRLSAAS